MYDDHGFLILSLFTYIYQIQINIGIKIVCLYEDLK